MDYADREDGGDTDRAVSVNPDGDCTHDGDFESLARSWSRTLQWCVKIAVGVVCAVAFNNLCAASPSADDSLRGAGSAVVAAIGAWIVSSFSAGQSGRG